MADFGQALLMYLFVMARVGQSRQNSQQATPRRVTYSDGQFPSVATTPSLGLYGTMMPEVLQARLICLFVMVRVGQSRQNSQQATPPHLTSSDIQFPSMASMPSLGLDLTMMADLIQARLMYIQALLLVLTTRERDYLRNSLSRRTTPILSTPRHGLALPYQRQDLPG